MSINLSKAFDCINREELLDLLRTLIPDSEFRIAQYLLSNTTLTTRIQGQLGKTFTTTIGTPQGDALSPILFNLYLEMALRRHKSNLPVPYTDTHSITSYADDTDFISSNYTDHFVTSVSLPPNLRTLNLLMNSDKTEHIALNRTSCPSLTNRKLGSKLGNKSDVSYRILQSNTAFSTLWKVWLSRSYITTKTKVKMYNATIKPILTYNLSSLAVPDHIFELLNSAHRKQLRRLLGIFYPKTISNRKLYHLTDSQPIQVEITQHRLRLLGHILRADLKTTANQMMIQYFTNPRNMEKYKGRQPITLPSILQRDLQLANHNLRNINDYIRLRETANNRETWSHIVDTIVHQVKTRCLQDLDIDETKRRAARQKRNRTTTTLSYTTEDGQRKRIILHKCISGSDFQLEDQGNQIMKRTSY